MIVKCYFFIKLYCPGESFHSNYNLKLTKLDIMNLMRRFLLTAVSSVNEH